MTRTYHRVRRSYDHRLRDAIAATGNADLFRDVVIPASTRRTWARGEVRPVVAAVDVELEVYELLEQLDKLRQRIKMQASIIGLLVRLLKLRGGKLDAAHVADGQAKSVLLRAIASASGRLSLGTTLKIVGVSSARYHAWRRKEQGCGLDDQPSCPKSFPSQLTGGVARTDKRAKKGLSDAWASRSLSPASKAQRSPKRNSASGPLRNFNEPPALH